MAAARGKYWEDLVPGSTFVSRARTVRRSDLRAFAALSGDRNPLHLDQRYASTTRFGRIVAHGVLGLALATGLLNRLGLTRRTLVALAGLEWRFLAPLYPGDRVRLVAAVRWKRKTSDPAVGLVKFRLELRNQRGRPVQEGTLVELVRRRG